MLFLEGQEGQALAEYALVLASVFVAALLAVGMLGVNLFGLFARIVEALNLLIGV